MATSESCALQMTVRPVHDSDRDWVESLTAHDFGSAVVVSRGHVHWPSTLAGLVVEAAGERIGLATLAVAGERCEVVTLHSLRPGYGVARLLLEHAAGYARQRGCRSLWLVTTNDNTQALRLYQRAGMRIVAVRLGAVAASRLLKPEIPLLGNDGITIRDEIELAVDLPD